MTWLPIYYPPAQDFADGYEAHCSGLVRNRKTGKVIKIHKRKGDGYCGFGMHRQGKRKFVYLHQAIAYTFLGDPPEGKELVDHIDMRPWNNSADNLRWATRYEQAANRSNMQAATTDPLQSGRIAALEWISKTLQISGETLREELIEQKVNN